MSKTFKNDAKIIIVQNVVIDHLDIAMYSGNVYMKKKKNKIFMIPHGYGKALYKDRRLCEGEWKRGKLNGMCTIIMPGQYKYCGQYVDNYRKGPGKYISLTETKIKSVEAEWSMNNIVGIVTIQYRNGTIYKGSIGTICYNDCGWTIRATGHGKLFLKDHSEVETIEGNWHDGIILDATINYLNGNVYHGNVIGLTNRNGWGKLIIKSKPNEALMNPPNSEKLEFPTKYDVQKIEAEWDMNCITGKASIKYFDGSRYFGIVDIVMRRCEHGIFFYPDGTMISGEWDRDKLIEKKMLMTKDKRRIVFNCKGTCRIHYPDKSVYYGEYDNQYRPCGRGKMKYGDGRIYNGSWWAGQKHGQGMMIQTNRDYYHGSWNHDMMHGRGIWTNYNIQSFIMQYVNNKWVTIINEYQY